MYHRSRRFDCTLLVFFRRWGRLVMRDLIKHDALLWLVVFQQLWLVHLDPCWSLSDLLPRRSAVVRLPCCGLFFLIVGIHTSGISIPLSLLMLLGWSLIWIASLTLRVKINKLYFIQEWLVSGVVGLLWNGGGLGTGESDVSIMLLNSVSST